MRAAAARNPSGGGRGEVGAMRGLPGCLLMMGSRTNPRGPVSFRSRIALRRGGATFAGGKSIRASTARTGQGRSQMCRNIKTLFNFEPPATEDEIEASALQFVRKLSGFNKPSQANADAFDRAVAEVSASARRLLTSLHTQAPARDREIEAEKARERSKLRFG